MMSRVYAQPTEESVQAFIEKLRAYRDTLPEEEQRLLNAMFFAAMGQPAEKDEDTDAYWIAAGPRGAVGWHGRPWGAAYGYYYPR
jgi:hypothetical protein